MIKYFTLVSLAAFLSFPLSALAFSVKDGVQMAAIKPPVQVKRAKTDTKAVKNQVRRNRPVRGAQNVGKVSAPQRARTRTAEVLRSENSKVDLKKIKPPVLKLPTLAEKYQPQLVEFSGYKPGSIVIDPQNYFLYFVESPKKARRYGIAVGQIGLQFKGAATISAKREWPRWIPTPEMIARNPARYARYANGMDGGADNPLGARALYLSQGNKDTYIRIHGTVQPWTIGTAASNGCFRMTNDHVMELYEKVQLGAEVVVL